MGYHDILAAAAGASAAVASILFFARVSARHRRLSLARWFLGWAHLPLWMVASIVCVGFTPVSLMLVSVRSLVPAADGRGMEAASDLGNVSDDGTRAIARLRAYVDQLPQSAHQSQTLIRKENTDLPDVETMISRLAARLENDKTDKDGWRTLGWSYLNTEKYADAVRAYETALALDPSDTNVKASLEEARGKLAKSPSSPDTSSQVN